MKHELFIKREDVLDMIKDKYPEIPECATFEDVMLFFDKNSVKKITDRHFGGIEIKWDK